MNLFDLLLAIVFKSSLILVCAIAMTRLFRKQSAALRHIVWVLAFAGTLALPLTIPFAPRVELPVAFWQSSELRHIDAATGEVLESLEMPAGVGLSGLEGDGKETFYCGGGDSGKVRTVKKHN